jgi:hypothetical protein
MALVFVSSGYANSRGWLFAKSWMGLASALSGNWRVTFTFAGKDVDRVDYEDYHCGDHEDAQSAASR